MKYSKLINSVRRGTVPTSRRPRMQSRLLFLILIATALPAAAQLPPRITVGQLARLDIICPLQTRGARCPALVGRVEALDSDSLTLRLAGYQSHRVAWADVQRLAISQRSRGHAGLGFLIGAGLGVLTGAIWKSDCLKDAGEYGGLCGLSYVITVPSGALIGTAFGALVRTPVWEVAPLPASHKHGATQPSLRFALVLSLKL